MGQKAAHPDVAARDEKPSNARKVLTTSRNQSLDPRTTRTVGLRGAHRQRGKKRVNISSPAGHVSRSPNPRETFFVLQNSQGHWSGLRRVSGCCISASAFLKMMKMRMKLCWLPQSFLFRPESHCFSSTNHVIQRGDTLSSLTSSQFLCIKFTSEVG